MVDLRAAWVCAIWDGHAKRLIEERVARQPPLAPRDVRAIRTAIESALVGHDYLTGPANEALSVLAVRR
jgi:hypothetical protein